MGLGGVGVRYLNRYNFNVQQVDCGGPYISLHVAAVTLVYAFHVCMYVSLIMLSLIIKTLTGPGIGLLVVAVSLRLTNFGISTSNKLEISALITVL